MRPNSREPALPCSLKSAARRPVSIVAAVLTMPAYLDGRPVCTITRRPPRVALGRGTGEPDRRQAHATEPLQSGEGNLLRVRDGPTKYQD